MLCDACQLRCRSLTRPEGLPSGGGGTPLDQEGVANLSALSRFFLKASSRKLVRVIFRSLYSFMMNSVACPEGSMISGYLRMGQGPVRCQGSPRT